jgi:hypothetical protein
VVQNLFLKQNVLDVVVLMLNIVNVRQIKNHLEKKNGKIFKMIDYHKFTIRSSTKEERAKAGVGDYYVNAAKCLKCNDIIRSKNIHDYVTCSCGNLSVDGGSWYLKRIVNDDSSYMELSEKFNDANI